MIDPNTTAFLNQMGLNASSIESLLSSLIVLTVVALVAAIPTAIIAKRKRRSMAFWLVFALSIPVIPLLLICLLPRVPPPPQQ